jgi:hypothetical protein
MAIKDKVVKCIICDHCAYEIDIIRTNKTIDNSLKINSCIFCGDVVCENCSTIDLSYRGLYHRICNKCIKKTTIETYLKVIKQINK